MNKVIERDPGLQPERTTLAWGRTVLLVGVNFLLLWRAALVSKNSLVMAAVCFSLIIFVVVLFIYLFRWRKLVAVKPIKNKVLNDLLAKLFVLAVLGLVVSTLCVVTYSQ